MSKQFRLTIYHDEDSYDLDPNKQDSPLFRLHSFNSRHNSYSDPERLLGCQNCGEATSDHPVSGWDDELICDTFEGLEGYKLSYFEHGQCRWGLQGTMSGTPDFRWDGVEYAGFLEVTVPEDERDWWDNRPEEDRRGAAEAFVSEYTDWCNGEAYGYSLERIQKKKCDLGKVHTVIEEEDSCFGFLGFEWFQEEVRGATFWMEATEQDTEIIDNAYGVAQYGRFFMTEEEIKEVQERTQRQNRRIEA